MLEEAEDLLAKYDQMLPSERACVDFIQGVPVGI